MVYSNIVQRISIARALYSERDIYILDDPFSALDAHVGRHVFDHAVQGMLKDKIVILTTNQLHFLSRDTYVILLEQGKPPDFNSVSFLRPPRKDQSPRKIRIFTKFVESIL